MVEQISTSLFAAIGNEKKVNTENKETAICPMQGK